MSKTSTSSAALAASERSGEAANAAGAELPAPRPLVPDSEVVARPHRRRFSPEYKRSILDQADAAKDVGAGFALYFLCGMLPWLALSEAAGRAPSILLEHRNFVKKLVFAVETLPVNLVAAGLVSEFFAVVLYCGFLLAIRHSLPVTVMR